MATNINDSVLLKEIDYIAAVVKAQAAVYSATVDAYDIMVKEQNPDDLINGVDASIALRNTLENSSGLFQQFAQMTSWLNQRAAAAGSSGVDALLTARGLRAPYSYDQYITYPSSSQHLTAGNIFYDTESQLGTIQYGGSSVVFSSGMLSLSGTYNVLGVETLATNSTNWHINIGSIYADNSTGTEVAFVPTGTAEGTTINIGVNPISSLAEVGAYVIPMTLGTTGLVAGQRVLLTDPVAPAMLNDNCALGQPYIRAEVSEVGYYSPGDIIWLKDNNGSETGTIEDVNYEYGTIKMRKNLANNYQIPANAYMYKATAAVDQKGWYETHTIASVSAAPAIAFSAPIRHTYFTGAQSTRLIKGITNIATASGGGGSDAVYVVTVSERTISQ